jgi:hypothetical protein
MLNVVCVFSENDDAVVEAISRIPGIKIVSHEYSWDSFLIWAETDAPSPDIVIGDGMAYVSSAEHGMNRNAALLDIIRTVRLKRPEIRFVLIFPTASAEDRTLISGIAVLGIYDIYIRDEYTIDDIESWLKKPADIKNVADYLPVDERFPGLQAEPHGIKAVFMDSERKVEKKPDIFEAVSASGRAVEIRSRRLYTVYSPVPAGKTFFAVNLAASLAVSGRNTALVDITGTGACTAWTNAVGDPRIGAHVPEISMVVYEKQNFTETLHINADYIVVDTPSYGAGDRLLRELLRESEKIFVVLDPDYSHSLYASRNFLSVDAKRALYILNKNIENLEIDPEEFYAEMGIKFAVKIKFFTELYNSIARGIPLAVEDRILRAKILDLFDWGR